MTLIRCVDPNAVEAFPLVIAATGQAAVRGDVVDVADSDLAGRLLLQEGVWEAVKAAKKPHPAATAPEAGDTDTDPAPEAEKETT